MPGTIQLSLLEWVSPVEECSPAEPEKGSRVNRYLLDYWEGQLSFYQRLIDRFTVNNQIATASGTNTPSKAAMREHIISHLNGLRQQCSATITRIKDGTYES